MNPQANLSTPTELQSHQSSHLPDWKRSIDLACCLIALPILAVLALGMLILTKIVSPGPIFFRQQRIGCMGRRFWIYKFRSMHVNADTGTHQNYVKDLIHTNAPMTKLDGKNDSRIIPGTWLLRASGLDELPQIINVLRGDMSIVGPRPCLPAEYEAYLPWQRQRCDAMPGLTGLWQVSGKNRTTFDDMIRLDIRYSKKLTLLQDLRIIFLTPVALLQQLADTRAQRRQATTKAAVALGADRVQQATSVR